MKLTFSYLFALTSTVLGTAVHAEVITPASVTSNAVDASGEISTSLFPPYSNGHIYLGGRAGWAAYQDACGDSVQNCTDDTFGYGIYGGYQLNSWFALEGGVTSYGSPHARYSTGKVSTDVWGGEMAVKLSYPLAQRWSVFSRLGASYQDIDKDLPNGMRSKSGNDWNTLATIGVSYRLAQRWSLRGEYQFIDGIGDDGVEQADLHFTSIGLTYHFGQKTPVAKVSEVETKVIAPRYVTESTPLSLSSKSLFSFDSSKLNISNELELLAEQLHTYPNDRIRIVGHTDSSGSEAYNQKLSEQRAQSVANYLMSTGIDRDRLTVVGLGESSPIATNDTAEGRAKNRCVDVLFDTTVEKTRPVDTTAEK
ncbi:porin [Vibrio hyugaensis]|uniref:porin n=1 Tax=Vibrio hyugaensis TaxID=1534743 RepID=UPI003DA0265F